MIRGTLRSFWHAVAILALSLNATAQVTTATLYGTVTDPSGASVPAATITLTHQETGTTLEKAAGDAGDFQFDFLRVGTYTLQIEAQGFKRSVSKAIELTAGQSVRQAFPLQIGSLTDTVQVEGTSPLVNTASAEQLQSFGAKTVKDLPLARRNFSSLLGIGAGVTPATGGSATGIRLNGVGKNGTAFSVDGTEASGNPEGRNAQNFGGVNYVDILSIESIEEVHIVKGILPAEYGGALGGQVNVMSRSGTNRLHGSLFENFQAENLNARDPFLNRKPPYTFNQFGGSVGGPIKKNRIFAFAAVEAYRESQLDRVEGNVPTQSMRDTVLRAQPSFADALAPVPLPNQPHNLAANNALFVGTGRSIRRDNHVDAKSDVRITDTSNLSLTYSRGRPYRLTPTIYAGNEQENRVWTERGTVSYVRGGASWTSETRFGYNMNDSHNVNMSFTKPVLDAAHPKEDFLYGRRLGRLSTNLGWGTLAGNQDLLLEGPTWSLGEKFSKHLGKHSLKFGGLFTHHCCQRDNVEAVGWTYSGLPDLLANIPSQINASFGNGEYTAKMWELGFFLQDDWRISSNLTLNLGLRYDYFSRMVAREDKNSGSFLFNPNGLIDDKFSVGAMRPTNDPYDSDRVNFGPRFGFAYNIRGKGKTVIRGGTGFIYSPQVIGNMWNLVGTKYAPKRILFSRQDAITLGLKYPMYNDDLRKVVERQAIAEGFTNIFGLIEPHIPSPYTHHYSLGFQRELTQTLGLESSFVGVRGTHFPMFRPMNEPNRVTGVRPNPKLRATFYLDATATSSYVSWQTSLRKKYSQHVSSSAHYTWGKSLAYNGGDIGTWYQGDNAARVQDFFNVRAERAPATGDIQHYFASEWSYEAPLLTARNALARFVAGGWQLGGIFTARTGEPLAITQASSLQVNRPDYIGGNAVNKDFMGSLQYLNRAAFALVPLVPASGASSRPGNLGWGAVRAPGAWNVDVSISRNFKLTETMKLQLRSDMFNVMNHLNPANVSTSLNANNFGQIRGSTGQRVIQLNARLSW